jgi:hypothetical protein
MFNNKNIFVSVICSLLLLTGMNVQAASEASAMKLINLLGFPKSFEQQKQNVEAQGAKATGQIISRALQGVTVVTPELKAKVEKIHDTYVSKISKVVNVDSMLKRYAKLLAPKLSQKEMDATLKFYGSTAGKKYYQANISASTEFTREMMGQVNQDMRKQMESLSQAMDKLVAEQKKK